MTEYDRLQRQKRAIIAKEKAREAQSIIARLMPYIQHDHLCAARDVGTGCTCGLASLLEELQEEEPKEEGK